MDMVLSYAAFEFEFSLNCLLRYGACEYVATIPWISCPTLQPF